MLQGVSGEHHVESTLWKTHERHVAVVDWHESVLFTYVIIGAFGHTDPTPTQFLYDGFTESLPAPHVQKDFLLGVDLGQPLAQDFGGGHRMPLVWRLRIDVLCEMIQTSVYPLVVSHCIAHRYGSTFSPVPTALVWCGWW